jgi:hypothetical protein
MKRKKKIPDWRLQSCMALEALYCEKSILHIAQDNDFAPTRH